MRLGIFLKTFAICTAAALVCIALSPSISLELIIRLAALDLGISILTPLIYPSIRGIKKGDKVIVIGEEEGLAALIGARRAVALENKKLHEKIKVLLDDGREITAIIESYAGLLSPAKVKIYEKEIEVI